MNQLLAVQLNVGKVVIHILLVDVILMRALENPEGESYVLRKGKYDVRNCQFGF